MRNGFDGLAGIVRNYLAKDPISGDVFVFLIKLRTHIKL
jgi:transposase